MKQVEIQSQHLQNDSNAPLAFEVRAEKIALRELQFDHAVCELEVFGAKPQKEIVQVMVEPPRPDMRHAQTSAPYVLLLDVAS